MKVETQVTKAIYPSLAGRRVLVTGGGSGIGSTIVETFTAQGADVWFIDIADADSQALVDQLSAAGIPRPPRYHRCDLTDLEATDATLKAILAEAGAIDVLVNNAANDNRHSLQDITPAYWDQNVAVNLRHMLFCSQAVAPGMIASGRGSIVNMGSISWHLALPDLLLYETAKGGIEGMTRALARDLGQHGVRVNCVVPGGIQTPRQTRLWHNPEEEARILGAQCLKERVTPEHVTAMVLFLASDDGRMCTGHNYFVDAGWR